MVKSIESADGVTLSTNASAFEFATLCARKSAGGDVMRIECGARFPNFFVGDYYAAFVSNIAQRVSRIVVGPVTRTAM